MLCFLSKVTKIYFVANLSSFQENFQFTKSVTYCQIYDLNNQHHFLHYFR